MTSTRKMRSCELAVSRMRSMASIAVLTAVSKPIVSSVPAMSLSIVPGNADGGKAGFLFHEMRAGERAVAADDDEAFDAFAAEGCWRLRGGRIFCRKASQRSVLRIVPPRWMMLATDEALSGWICPSSSPL